jgi:hypothetical protein
MDFQYFRVPIPRLDLAFFKGQKVRLCSHLMIQAPFCPCKSPLITEVPLIQEMTTLHLILSSEVFMGISFTSFFHSNLSSAGDPVHNLSPGIKPFPASPHAPVLIDAAVDPALPPRVHVRFRVCPGCPSSPPPRPPAPSPSWRRHRTAVECVLRHWTLGDSKFLLKH